MNQNHSVKILIAEDDAVSRRLLERILAEKGYNVVAVQNGQDAWEALQQQDAPMLAILDWMMPGMDGVEVIRCLHAQNRSQPAYLILVTAKGNREDIVEGLQAGANDYITKPFDSEELQARIQVAARMVFLQSELANRVKELEQALSQVRRLQGLLPICCYCKKIRDDRDYWHEVETYIGDHSEAMFSHGICPSCFEKHVKPEIELLKQKTKCDRTE